MRQVRQRLAQQSVAVMDYGGRFVEASARTSLLLMAVILQSAAAILLACDRYLERERKLSDKAHALRGRAIRREFTKATPVAPKPLQPLTPTPPKEARQNEAAESPKPEVLKPRVVARSKKAARTVAEQAQYQTAALLDRVSKLMASMSMDDERIRVFVISNEMQHSIRSAAESLGLPESIIQSLYPWILDLSEQWDLTIHIKPKSEYQALQSILQYVEKHRPSPVLEVAMVEDRDLPPEAYRLLSLLSKHVTLFADNGRRIQDCF